jgi:hypothetical protein
MIKKKISYSKFNAGLRKDEGGVNFLRNEIEKDNLYPQTSNYL